ncbi:Serine/threonine-protein kinase pkn1 [Enhygromyxa salina]|uniref:Serine/threonine-protein kinase pkn1 n=1 Tax=Enhygromyxa salina TaxID=215803 RepID=A0A2S9XTU3_9BACT|nr:Serine/threonine-protein kinase pkn1 [Enhygromyxa salina]
MFAHPNGAARWGQHDVAGSVWEWTLDFHDPDWYAGAGNDCQDCGNVSGNGARVLRGGSWNYNVVSLRNAKRFPGSAAAYWLGAGIRCARN